MHDAQRSLHVLCFPEDLDAGAFLKQMLEALARVRDGAATAPLQRIEVRISFHLTSEPGHDGCSVHLYLSEGAMHLGTLAGLAMVSLGYITESALPTRTRLLIAYDPAWDRG